MQTKLLTNVPEASTADFALVESGSDVKKISIANLLSLMLETTSSQPSNITSGWTLIGGGYWEFGPVVVVQMRLEKSDGYSAGTQPICNVPAAADYGAVLVSRIMEDYNLRSTSYVENSGRLTFSPIDARTAVTRVQFSGVYIKQMEA